MPTRLARISFVLSLSGCLHAAPVAAPPTPLPEDATQCFASVDAALSDDALEGRGVGTAGLDRAGDLVEGWLRGLGVQPTPSGYRQPFDVTVGITAGPGNRLRDSVERAIDRDFMPLGFSSSGAFAGPVVFAGYGITAADKGYDDYAGVDVRGKVVLALRYEPGENDEKSPFDGKRPSRWSDLRYKAHLAKQAGAAALVLVTGPGNEPPDATDPLPALKIDGPTSDAGIPVLQVTRATADAWLAADNLSLAKLQAQIDASYAPASKPLTTRVDGAIDLAPVRKPVANVLGVIPGHGGAIADEVVVVGAHLDHLGHGGRGSFQPDTPAIHNGADDNASGVAAMLCGVRRLKLPADHRTIVIAAFTAEEIGLGGSSWYAEHPILPLQRTVAMINLDMVGRVREQKLQVLGTDTAPEWTGWLAKAAVGTDLRLTMGGDGYGPSDQTAFYAAGVPVIHLFSGAHPEYHTPSDDFATINTVGGGQVATLLGNLLSDVTAGPKAHLQTNNAGPPLAGDSRGYGAYLGTIPDYSAMEAQTGGVLLSGVRAGGPAERAGLRGGDRIVKMGDVDVRNLYDMTFVLRDHRPNESVAVTVDRAGERVTLLATLAARGGTGEPGKGEWRPKAGKEATALIQPDERHLADLRQLTFGGDNAEAYWTPDGRHLTFQRTGPEGGCDQEYLYDLDTGEMTLMSSGKGRTTCGYASYPDGKRYLYATTEHLGPACPPKPDPTAGYVWSLYDYDIVWSDGPGQPTKPWLPSTGYDAEATVCPIDGRVVFTSTRDGDLELYTANADGSNLARITNTPGYDGGAFFTADCSEIIWRASRPTGAALDEYRSLLARGLVRPSQLELFRANADGSHAVQLTDNGAANFAPFPYPDKSRILFSSNAGGSAREFDILSVSRDGGILERITSTAEFDGFPMFSPDGKWLVFASNRGGANHETNLFIARWVP